MQANIKTKNGKKLKVKALVDSGCMHIGINEQLVKDKRIQTKPINFLFEVFNANGTKNGEVAKVAPLEIEINRHKKTLEAAVTDLDGVTNFIQLVSPQPVDRFSQTKLRQKAPNEGYPHIYGIYKSDNKRLRYQDINSCKSFVS